VKTRQRLDDTGVQLIDAPTCRLEPDTDVDEFCPMLGSAAYLSATKFNVNGNDPDDVRLIALDPTLVPYVQLCDGPRRLTPEQYLWEAGTERLLPAQESSRCGPSWTWWDRRSRSGSRCHRIVGATRENQPSSTPLGPWRRCSRC